MAYQPKNFIELCMAWKMNARVEINGYVGTIVGITKSTDTAVWFVEFVEEPGEGYYKVGTTFRE